MLWRQDDLSNLYYTAIKCNCFFLSYRRTLTLQLAEVCNGRAAVQYRCNYLGTISDTFTKQHTTKAMEHKQFAFAIVRSKQGRDRYLFIQLFFVEILIVWNYLIADHLVMYVFLVSRFRWNDRHELITNEVDYLNVVIVT